MEFETEEEYLAAISDYLVSLSVPRDIIGPLSIETAHAVAVVRFPNFPPGTIGLLIPKTYWVIRNDDLKLMETLWSALNAAASVKFFQQPLTASAITGILAATFKLAHTARKKGVKLTPDQHRLLLALRACHQGSTVADLRLRLGAMSKQEPCSDEDLLAQLSNLTKVRLSDGTIVPLVAQDSEGLWSTCGV